MKASIKKDTNFIQGFHDDNYDFGNPKHPDRLELIQSIEVVNLEMDKPVHNCGAYKYELIDGVVKERDITQTQEYANWIDRQREAKYREQSDKLLYKFLEKLAATDTDGQKWLTEKAKIKEEIK